MSSSIPVICSTWVVVLIFVTLANTNNRKGRLTFVFSLALVLLTGCFTVLYFVWDNKSQPQPPEKFLVPGKKYVTLTQSPEGCKKLGEFPKNGDPYDDNTVGLIHARMCLQNLIILSRKTGRTAVFPPPWMYLSRWHNNGKFIDDCVWWDRYYNLDEYIENGEIAPKEIAIHDAKGQRGKILIDCEYVEPDTSYKTIKSSDSDLVTLHLYAGWGNNKENKGWTCGGTEFGGGIGHGWQRSLPDIVFEPSNQVLETAESIQKELGVDFVMIHVRRGDVLTIDNYWGISKNDIDRITSSAHIAEFLKKRDVSTDTSILIMTNETDTEHFSELKKVFPNTKLESDLDALQKTRELDDNFLTYEIMRKVANAAKIRISTAPCYFDSPCNYALREDIS